ncbi:MAG: hypothetical protein A2W31_15430 [Planctomycetes bacterium RBG_16_64_10]|nr:MAG: hypothetical protein A2W31_15430 [Planctomycetes bacterium RBG_16_64_10]
MKIAFFSTMEGVPWGASEELWSQAAGLLQQRGHQVAVSCKYWPALAPRLQAIQHHGGAVQRRSRLAKIVRNVRRSFAAVGLYRGWLKRLHPDLVLVSSASQTGDLSVALDCLDLGVPYAILLHAANPAEGVRAQRRALYRQAYEGARTCFFVSQAVLRLMRALLASRFAAAEIVENPPNVSRTTRPPWPATEPVWKLACPARFDLASKGHDVIFEVLSDTKWRDRPLQVCLWGPDSAERAHLAELARLLGVHPQVEFCGLAHDIGRLWAHHHGLLLPSRHEGVPMATVEAMLCGRIPIVTQVGRNAEFVDDGETGFLAAAATVELVDQALERAWQERDRWQSMGRLAAHRIRQRTSADPVADFCDRLLQCAADA